MENIKDMGDTTPPNGAEGVESAESPPSAEALAQEKIKSLENQVSEKEQKYVYLYAEFENFKKRTQKERTDLIKFASEPLITELLQIIDNLERAVVHTPADTNPALVNGLQMILKQFEMTLDRFGVTQVPTQKAVFDPAVHEAVGEEFSDQIPAGSVCKAETQGYTLHGRLVRPARVIISKGKEEESSPA